MPPPTALGSVLYLKLGHYPTLLAIVKQGIVDVESRLVLRGRLRGKRRGDRRSPPSGVRSRFGAFDCPANGSVPRDETGIATYISPGRPGLAEPACRKRDVREYRTDPRVFAGRRSGKCSACNRRYGRIPMSDLPDERASSSGTSTIDAERRQITVLFSDLVNAPAAKRGRAPAAAYGGSSAAPALPPTERCQQLERTGMLPKRC